MPSPFSDQEDLTATAVVAEKQMIDAQLTDAFRLCTDEHLVLLRMQMKHGFRGVNSELADLKSQFTAMQQQFTAMQQQFTAMQQQLQQLIDRPFHNVAGHKRAAFEE